MNYLYYGLDEYRKKQAITQILKKSQLDEINIERVDATRVSVQSILDDAITIPFLADEKVIIVEQCPYFSANSPLDEAASQALLAYLERPMPSTHLIFSCVSEKLDSRKKLVKQALQYCKHEAFAPLEEREIKLVMDRKLKPYVQVLSEKSIQHIYQSIGKDLESFERFLEKLALQGDEIDDATIFFLLPRKLEDDVFELMSALLQKNRTKAFSLLQDFASNNIEPIQLIGILASQLRFIFQVLHLYQSGLNETEITSELGVHPYRVKLAVKNRRDISSDRALYYLHELSGLDQKIKHGKIEKRLGLELFFIQALG